MDPRVSFLCVAILTLPLTGCLMVQIPSRHPVAGRKDLDFIKPGKTLREEVHSRLGGEDVYYKDLRIGCYRRNEVTYRQWLFILIFPTLRGPGQAPSSDLAYIQYDRLEYVSRVVNVRAVRERGWRERAEEIAGLEKAK